MIQVAPGTKVHLALRPLSMRYGFDGLSAKVVEVLRGDPFSGHLFIFRDHVPGRGVAGGGHQRFSGKVGL